MAKLTQYTRQARPSAGQSVMSASAGSAGVGLQQAGADITETAGRFQAAFERKESRRDAVSETKAEQEYMTYLNDEVNKIQIEQDITSPSVLTDYGVNARAKLDQILGLHEGSDTSRARLTARLEQSFGSSSRTLASASNALGKKLVADGLTNSFTGVAEDVTLTGDVEAGMLDVDLILESKAGGMTPLEETAQRAAGRSAVITAGFERAMGDGDFERAQSLLDMEGAAEDMGLDGHRALRRTLTVERRKAEVKDNKFATEVADIEAVLGRKLTPAELSRKANIAAPAGSAPKQGLQDKIDEYVEVTGKYPAQAQIDIWAGAYIEVPAGADDGAFGNGLRGRVLDIFSDNAVGFASNTLGEQDERVFQSALTEWLQPRSVPNPDTGVMELITPTLPPFVAEALDRRGIDPAIYTAAAEGAANAEVDFSAGGIPTLPPDKTMWGMAELVAGPGPAIRTALDKNPFLGGLFSSPEQTEARAAVEGWVNSFVKVLQTNTKSAVERVELKKELGLSPDFWDRPEAYRSRLIGKDVALETMKAAAISVLQAPQSKSTVEDRQEALNRINAIISFQAVMGLPSEEERALTSGGTVEVDDIEAAKQLAPGTPFYLKGAPEVIKLAPKTWPGATK